MTLRPSFLLVAFLTGCSSSPSAPGDVPVGREFVLKPGESATVEGTDLRITFQSVVEDSRCPVDVTCVHAGDAVVALAVGDHPLQLRSNSEPEEVVGGHILRLERVDPKAYSDRTIPPGDYRAVLKVTAR